MTKTLILVILCSFVAVVVVLVLFCFVVAVPKLFKLSYSDLYDGVRRKTLRAIVCICRDLCFGV